MGVPLEKLHRHPKNRRPKEAAILEMMQLLEATGQQTSIEVRDASGLQELPLGHFELIKGETRLLAAQRLGWTTLRAEMRTGVDDSTATRDLVAGNLGRTDLDPIQRAEALQLLLDHVEDGGAWMTVSEVAALHGKSVSWVKNSVRLLALPQFFRDLVIEGKLAERKVRELVPFCGCDHLMKAFARHFKGREKWWWERDDSLRGVIRIVVNATTRPMDKSKHDYGYELGNDHPRYFPKDATDGRVFNPVEIPAMDDRGKTNGKTRLVTFNVRGYDKLQEPLIKAKMKRRGSESGPKRCKTVGGKPSAGERRRKATADAETLENRKREWLERFRRLMLADALRAVDVAEYLDSQVIAEALRWFVELAEAKPKGFGHAMFAAAGGREPKSKWESVDVWKQSLEFAPQFSQVEVFLAMQVNTVATVLWDDLAAEKLTYQMPWVDPEHVATSHRFLALDVGDQWADSRERDTPACRMVRLYFELHSVAQLDMLSKKLDTISNQVQNAVREAKTKTAKVAALLACHIDPERGPLRLLDVEEGGK